MKKKNKKLERKEGNIKSEEKKKGKDKGRKMDKR